MFIEIAQAGVISDAPTINEILVNALQRILAFVGGLSILMIIGSGILYKTSSGNKDQHDLSRKVLIGSVGGLVLVLLSLVIVGSIVKVF